MKIVRLIAAVRDAGLLSFAALAQGKPAPKDAFLYFVWPQNGAVDQRRILVPFRPAQHGRDPCRR